MLCMNLNWSIYFRRKVVVSEKIQVYCWFRNLKEHVSPSDLVGGAIRNDKFRVKTSLSFS